MVLATGVICGMRRGPKSAILITQFLFASCESMLETVPREKKRQGIACAGNWILDTVHTISHWPEKSGLAIIESQHIDLGGGPANVALGLRAMGVSYPVIPIGLIGSGGMGGEVLRLCVEAGLPIDGMKRTTLATTSQTHVMNVQGDSRTFFHHRGANSLFDASSINLDALSKAEIKLLYLGYLTLLDKLDEILPSGKTAAAHVLSEARANGIQTCVDLASFKSDTYQDIVKATLSEIDILFANELEAEEAAGVNLNRGLDAEEMMKAARFLKSGGVRQAVIIHSPKNVVWYGDNVQVAVTPEPIPPEEIISAVGAGDAFASGVLHGVHEDWPVESCLTFGIRAAAACLSGYTATDGLKTLSVPASPF
ncbi:carbohydrate kinase family protein [Primorskyibacter aestuariivivens]|uniref:carbohydrate kinase family protein n=1 Tax=Primorskyibacter aestuariivivens TaxID=1888912 RepID=UPI0023008286|nr:carbohydrate kinase family protein [Primorskyibacter aestuariivivens]MDA7428652.1 carbohydrate kinase family protein [Primorskyibacter aestuariivivens]